MLKADGLIGGEMMFDDFKSISDCRSMKGIVLELMRSEVQMNVREPFEFVGLICLPDVRGRVKYRKKAEVWSY